MRSGRHVGWLALGLVGLLSLAGIGCSAARVRPGGSLPARSVTKVGDETISRTSGDSDESVEVIGSRQVRRASSGHGALVGRVIDDDGRPVSGATVRSAIGGPGSKPARAISAKTDEAGRFSLADLPLGSEWTLIAEPPGDSMRPGRIQVRVPNDRVRIHLPAPDPFVHRDEKEIRLQRASSADPAAEGAEWADLPADDENPLPPAREPEGDGGADPEVLPSSNNKDAQATWGIPPRFERAPGPEEILATRNNPKKKETPSPSAPEAPEAGKLAGGRAAEPRRDRDAAPAGGSSTRWQDLDWGQGPAGSPEPAADQAPPEAARARLESPGAGFAEAACDYDPRAERLADFQLPDLDGKAFRLSEAKAELVLLDFWGSWCPPCRASIPHLISLQKRYSPEGLQVVGIAYEEGTLAQGAGSAGKHAREAGINYPVLLGREQDCPVRTALGVDVYPSLVLLDRSGRILWRGKGATPDTLKGLDRAVADAIRRGRTGR